MSLIARMMSVNILIFYLYLRCSVEPCFPVHTGTALREDIITLIDFWRCMHSDKKYLQSSEASNVSGR